MRIAIVGMGYRATTLFKLFQQVEPDVSLGVVVDPQPEKAKALAEKFGVACDHTVLLQSITSLEEHAGEIDGIMIGTRCNLHAPLAVQVANLRKPLFLEKPVAISSEQLEALAAAYRGRESSVVVSFPLRCAPLFSAVKEIVQSGRLGTINSIAAINHVPYGGIYFGEWYRSFDDTGGLWLQKATHDLDVICALVGSEPVLVSAVHTRKIFGGVMAAGLRCKDCDRVEECMESPINIVRRGDDGGVAAIQSRTVGSNDHLCVFGEEIRHHDAGSALLQFSNGTIASYNQNFVSRRSAAKRGAIITGYRATLEFDFPTKSIRVIDHHSPRVDRIEIPSTAPHSGGDEILLRNFADVVRGKGTSNTPLTLGLNSAALCLAAEISASGGRTIVPKLFHS